MFVYLFKFASDTAETGANNQLIEFLQSLTKEEGDQFNYLPSKERVVVGVNKSIYNEIRAWLQENVTYPFEFEEHCDIGRSLTQYDPITVGFSVQYLIPLFTPESYLNL